MVSVRLLPCFPLFLITAPVLYLYPPLPLSSSSSLVLLFLTVYAFLYQYPHPCPATTHFHRFVFSIHFSILIFFYVRCCFFLLMHAFSAPDMLIRPHPIPPAHCLHLLLIPHLPLHFLSRVISYLFILSLFL